MKKVKLICLPYAGSTAAVYYKWNRLIEESIEIIPIDYPGHGTKSNEDLCDNLQLLVDNIWKEIEEIIFDGEYSIFGHSMGSAVAYELVRRIQERRYQMPKHVFFSGRKPPHLCNLMTSLHSASISELRNYVLELGETPEEVFDNQLLSNIFIPIIRADYKVLEKYEFQPCNRKLNCDISILYGNQDKLTFGSDIDLWDDYSYFPVTKKVFQGEHFFINTQLEQVITFINKKILEHGEV